MSRYEKQLKIYFVLLTLTINQLILYPLSLINLIIICEMSGTRGRGAPATSGRNQPPAKKGQDVKQGKKEWAAEDYVSESVSLEEVREIKGAFDIFDSDSSGVVDPI